MPKNNEETFAILRDRQGRDVALKGVRVRARLHGLLAEVEVEQRYSNAQATNIEAVYTFPLPLGAALLGLEVEIAGKTLAGQAVERKQAERRYEDAVTDGDSAVMLEEASPGLYTASLGNLMAGESATIRYRYGLLLSWQGPRLRFLLPTTIAPRYGDPLAAGLQPHQVPVAALDVAYPLDLAVTVAGELANAVIASPSHPISTERTEDGVVVRLAGQANLDRDFVLAIESDRCTSSCQVVADGDTQVAFACLRIPPVAGTDDRPLALKLVIDCSGSMAGISIAQARKAVLEVLNQLRPTDTFNVTLFGSDHRHLFDALVPATLRNITAAWNRLGALDADMGGTEMETAINAAIALRAPDGEAAILLITDGEIHQHQALVDRARKSGQRVFVVGVGTAVAETFLCTLAESTGGACELVAPQEGMGERMLAQFHRMRQPKLGRLRIQWPAKTSWETPLPDTVFAGDTVHAFAGFAGPVGGELRLSIAGSGEVVAPIEAAADAAVPRMAAAARFKSVDPVEGLRLALAYQLLSPWTNYLVVAERADKAATLPRLHQVPQMLAAGWGGTGAVVFPDMQCSEILSAPVPERHSLGALPSRRAPRMPVPIQEQSRLPYPFDFAAKSAPPSRKSHGSMDRAAPAETGRPGVPAGVSHRPLLFLAMLERYLEPFLPDAPIPGTVDILEQLALPTAIAADLRELLARGHDESQVVAAFLHALVQSPAGGDCERACRRAVLKGWKAAAPAAALDRAMAASLTAATTDDWAWNCQALHSANIAA